MDYLKTHDKRFELHSWGVSCLGDQDVLPSVLQAPDLQKRQGKRYDRWLDGGSGLSRQLLREPPEASYEPRYMDLRFDFSFKYVFGKERNKDLLTDLLNSLFQDRKVIPDIQFSPTERLGEEKKTRKVLFDLLCTGDQGEQILIEMQRERQDNFLGRLLHYVFRLGSEQVLAGKKGDNYPIPEIFGIAILDFDPWDGIDLPPGLKAEYINSYNFRHTRTCDPYPKKAELMLVELQKFHKGIDELQTRTDKWLYLIKNLHRLREPVFQDDPIFRKLFQPTQINNLSKEDKMFIDHERDMRNIAKSRKREAMKKGREAMKKGMEKGMEKGRMEGEKNKELSFVQTLIRDTDFDDRKIASLAAVEESFVKNIRREINFIAKV